MEKMYFTKYALTEGIKEVEASTTACGNYYNVKGHFGLVKKCDVHDSRQGAIEAAEEMRIKRLQSLSKQMEKVSRIVFC